MQKGNYEIPEYFKSKILSTFGVEGEVWLNQLPGLLDTFVEKWNLAGCQTGENLSFNYIIYAFSPKYGEVVLKAGIPRSDLFNSMDALRFFGGKYCCRIYETDRQNGIMLMERILPGMQLKEVADFKKRLKIGRDMVVNLPTELPEKPPVKLPAKLSLVMEEENDFPTYGGQISKAFDWVRNNSGVADKVFFALLSIAENLYGEIKSLNRPKLLLHGDLHHENILQDGSGEWRVIDPHGKIGERLLEAGRFLINEWQWFGGIGDLKHMTRCIDFFAKALGESRRTIAISAFLDYALTSCWTLEDGGSAEDIKTAVRQMRCLLDLIY